MIEINPDRWRLCKANSPSQKLFIERWAELFNRYTIDIYRVRFHNSHTILRELLDLITTIESIELPLKHLQWVAQEAGQIISRDPLIKDNYNNYYPIIQTELNNQSNWNNKEPISKIKYSIKHLVNDLSQNYIEYLINELNNSITYGNLEKTYKLTGLLATESMSNDFNQFYLYSQYHLFFNVSYSDFGDCFKTFKDLINKPSEDYLVILRIDASLNEDFPSKIFDVEIVKNQNPLYDTADEKTYLSGGHYIWYAKININAKDHYIAAIKAAQKLENALDVVNYGFPLQSFSLNPEALVYKLPANPPKLARTNLNIPGFYKSNTDWFERISENIRSIYEDGRINDSTKDKIRSSMRYIRQGRAAINPEEQFLNFWIAFEFLMRTEGYRNILESIRQFAPKIMSLYYPRKLLRDFIENLNRLKIKYSDNVRRVLDIDRQFDKKEIGLLYILRNESLKNELYQCIDRSEILKYRLNELAISFNTSHNIFNLVNCNKTIIEWHLARIYRLRNRIVHGAAHNLIIDQLSANLFSYLLEILNEAIYQLPKIAEFNSIDDFILSYSFAYNTWSNILKNDKNSEIPIQYIVEPLQLLFQNA